MLFMVSSVLGLLLCLLYKFGRPYGVFVNELVSLRLVGWIVHHFVHSELVIGSFYLNKNFGMFYLHPSPSLNMGDCAWSAIFADSSRAQLVLGGPSSPAMSKETLEKFFNMKMICLITNQDNRSIRHGSGGVMCTIVHDHIVTGGVYEETSNTFPSLEYDEFGWKYGKLKITTGKVAHWYELRRQLESVQMAGQPFASMAEAAWVDIVKDIGLAEYLHRSPTLDRTSRKEDLEVYIAEKTWCIWDADKKSWMGGKKPTKVPSVTWVNGDLRQVKFGGRTGKTISCKDQNVWNCRYFVFMQELLYFRGETLAENVLKLLRELPPFYTSNGTLLEGVPGCGKTTKIHRIASQQCRDGLNVLVLSATVMGAAEFSGMKPLYEVRTIDQIAMNNWKGLQMDWVHIDEGLMPHSGVLSVVLTMTKPTIGYTISGDRRQLGYACRLPGYTVKWNDLGFESFEMEWNNYRSPASAVRILNRWYFGKMVCMTGREGTINIRLITATNPDLPVVNKYLTFTQNDKKALLIMGFNACTVNEFQGKSADKICGVRLSNHYIPPAEDEKQMLVLLSRHRYDFTYCTVKKDPFYKLLENANVGSYSEEVEKTACVPEEHDYNVQHYPLEVPYTAVCKRLSSDYFVEYWPLLLTYMPQILVMWWFTYLAWQFSPPVFRHDTGLLKPSLHMIRTAFGMIYEEVESTEAEETRSLYCAEINPAVIIRDLWKFSQKDRNPRDALTPRINTPHAPAPRNSLHDKMVALEKRNIEPPNSSLTDGQVVDELTEAWISTYIDEDALYQAKIDNSYVSTNALVHTIRNKSPAARTASLLELMTHPKSFTKSALTLKSPMKFNPYTKEQPAIGAAQTISAHSPGVTALFVPFFSVANRILCLALKDKFKIKQSCTDEELMEHLTRYSVGEKFKTMELDISKYDKSQRRDALYATANMYVYLGVPEEIMEMWVECHVRTELRDFHSGFSLYVLYTMLTGHANTYGGNTNLNLGVMAFTFPLSDCLVSLFAGDDSIPLFPLDVEVKDESQFTTLKFNLETKMLSFKSSVYFCSCYLVVVRGRWVMVPDPLKFVAKLGRDDIEGEIHLRAMQVAWRAQMKCILDSEVRDAVELALKGRVLDMLDVEDFDAKTMVDTMYWCVLDFQYLKSFYMGTQAQWSIKPRRETLARLIKRIGMSYSRAILEDEITWID